MSLFLEIALSNVVLLFVLIAVHEVGHWFFGRLAGIPRDQMRIRLFTFPQQVQLREGSEWLSVSTFDRYMARLCQFVTTRDGRFLYVVGGFLFETVFLIALSVALIALNFKLYAIVAPGVSLAMYLIYLVAMDLPQSRRRGRPWGDTTILFALARRPAMMVAAGMIAIRVVLIVAATLTHPTVAGWLKPGP